MAKIRHQSLNFADLYATWEMATLGRWHDYSFPTPYYWGCGKVREAEEKYITGQTAPSPFHRSVLISCLQKCNPRTRPLKPFTIFQRFYTRCQFCQRVPPRKLELGSSILMRNVLEHHDGGETLRCIHLRPFRYPGTLSGKFHLRSILPGVKKKPELKESLLVSPCSDHVQ